MPDPSPSKRNGAPVARRARAINADDAGVPETAGSGRWTIMPEPDVPVPRVRRRRSRLHGWGMFAAEDIPKNKRIIAYTGQKIPNVVSLARERRYLRTGNIWCFKLNARWTIDGAVGGSAARYINHSCRPNCYTQIIDGVIWVRAARTIFAGEELTYNYNTEGQGQIACRCRPDCETLL